jgi:hypothetical protein
LWASEVNDVPKGGGFLSTKRDYSDPTQIKYRGLLWMFDQPTGGRLISTKWDDSDPTPTRWLLGALGLEFFVFALALAAVLDL